MFQSVSANLAAALVKAQAAFRAAPKDSSNPAFRSRYADLASIVETVRPVLGAHGLAFVQPVTTHDDGTITVATVLLHASGETLASPGVTIRPAKADAHGIGSAITYARRYDLCALLGIVADVDDDGNAASGTGRQPQHEAPRPINLEALRGVVSERGIVWSELVDAVGGDPETWTAADRPRVVAAMERLAGGAA